MIDQRKEQAWKSVPLGTLAEFRNGVNFTKESFGRGIKVINVKDFQDRFKPSYEELTEINPEGVVRENDLLEEDDILFVRSNGNRQLIGRSLLIKGAKEPVTHSAFTIRARFRSVEAFPLFYAYALRSYIVRDALSAFGGGTNINNLNQSILSNLQVPLPPLAAQRKIAEILSTYDDLIENNARRIKILEEMAQALYREWFVHSRFPGHERVQLVSSPLGEIPSRWEATTVAKLVQRVPSGKKYETKTVSPIGAIPVLDQGQSGIIGYHDDQPGVIATEDQPVIVFANHTCYQRIIQFPFSAIQNVLPFIPNPARYRDIYWLHWATKDLVKFNDYKGHWPEFMSKRLILPDEKLCSAFGRFAQPIVRETYKLERKNINLRRTRDLLLPKLISSEIELT